MMKLMAPEWVVALPIYLVHADCKESGSIFEAGAGHYSKIRWERSRGQAIARTDRDDHS
jgi:multifunctional beta-oxidation protein